MSKVIGIDLGTTNSCVAVVESGKAVVIPNSEGTRTTPSVVALSENNEWLVGQVAKRQAVTNPENTVFATKRLIGRRYESDVVQEAIHRVPFKVVTSESGDAWIQLGDRLLSPPEISAHILRKMRESAEDFLGATVTDAVITVPAYFNDSQRQATRDAGRIAGLNVLRIINEPTAAAISFGLLDQEPSKVAVYDMGGGTFDISILEIGSGILEVMSTSGDTYLGGEDFDDRIVDWLASVFSEEHGIDLRGEPGSLQRLKEAAEKAKCDLSSIDATQVDLPFISHSDAGPLHLSIELTRTKLEELTADLIDRSLEPCQNALTDAAISQSDLDLVLLVGGQTRMPQIKTRVGAFFQRAPSEIMNPDEVVASGAAIQAGVLRGEVDEVLLLDVTPLSMGVETAGGVFTKIIDRNTNIPCTFGQVFSTSVDHQSLVSIHVLQGERPLAADNHSLATFDLLGIPPAPRGVPQIEVTFNIDADGIVSVTAKELGTGKNTSVRVQASGGLAEDEIEEMIESAQQYEDDDSIKKARVDLLNRAKGLIYTTEKSLEEYAELLGTEAIEPAREALAICTNIAEAPDPPADELLSAVTRLEDAAYQLVDALYSGDAEEEGDLPNESEAPDETFDEKPNEADE